MALEKWRKWRKSGIDPFGRYGQPEKHASPPCLSIGIRDSQTFNSYCPETFRNSPTRE
jgi:hypothetical protein